MFVCACLGHKINSAEGPVDFVMEVVTWNKIISEVYEIT
jgi:hypothetical protein